MSTLGFDTSNYTTSVALFKDGEFLHSRKILPVKEGERGLRQSDALFHHIKQIPEVLEGFNTDDNICAVGVSDKPRDVDGSYMPVFLAGVSFAEIAAKVLNVPLYKFSHQDGHIMAGILSGKAEKLLDKKFISVHMSGGTTEILETNYNGYNFDVSLAGGTKDISAGQVIDRIGVKLGFPFPAGKYMDAICFNSSNPVALPVSCKDAYFNFSGLETKASSCENCDKSDLAAGVFSAVAKTLSMSVNYAIENSDCCDVLFVGGVASSKYIKEKLSDQVNGNVYFAEAEFSSDNACGIAALADMCVKRR